MTLFSSPWGKKYQHAPEPAEKRISTAASQRLSSILDNGDRPKTTRDEHRSFFRKGAALSTIGDVESLHSRQKSPDSSSYSFTIWSEIDALKNHEKVRKAGGWKKLSWILLGIIIILIAVIVGLVIGLKKGGQSASHKVSNPDPASSTATATVSDAAGITTNPTPTISPVSIPTGFPLGSYSLTTFLDTVQTNCTSNPSTWSCFPYTIYNTSPSKSLTTFNWVISASSDNTKYSISSTENPFDIIFEDVPLELLDQGKDTERYRFQTRLDKTVDPDDEAMECSYSGTTFQGTLYTKMAKGYPEGENSKDVSFPLWPFAVLIEQTMAGGEDTPTCYKLGDNGKVDKKQKIKEGLEAMDTTSLCSCLYKNWRPPNPHLVSS